MTPEPSAGTEKLMKRRPSLSVVRDASKRGWFSAKDVNYRRWIPCPPVFPEGMDVENWAHQYAEGIWKADPEKCALAEMEFRYLYRSIYSPAICHDAFLHARGPEFRPLPVFISSWAMQGRRDQQLRGLAAPQDKNLMESPIAEEFWTEGLGNGLKSLCYESDPKGSGDIFAWLGYAWRSEEYETDLQLLTGCDDLRRLHRTLPDIDDLARALKFIPQ